MAGVSRNPRRAPTCSQVVGTHHAALWPGGACWALQGAEPHSIHTHARPWNQEHSTLPVKTTGATQGTTAQSRRRWRLAASCTQGPGTGKHQASLPHSSLCPNWWQPCGQDCPLPWKHTWGQAARRAAVSSCSSAHQGHWTQGPSDQMSHRAHMLTRACDPQDTFKGKGRDFPMTQANKQACCPGTGSPLHFAISCITTNSPRHSSGRASGRLYPQQPFRRLHGRARALPVCMCEEYLRTWDGTKGLRTVSSKRWLV